MKKVSMKKLSILGLVLMGASAVTAAILPGKSSAFRAEGNDNGTLKAVADGATTDADRLTCIADNTLNFSCNRSNLSGQTTNTSSPAGASSVRNGLTTQDQTSNSNGGYASSVEI